MAGRCPKNTGRQDGGEQDAVETELSANAERAPNDSSDPSRALAVAIEAERTELRRVHGMLRVFYDVLLYSDDDDALMHAGVPRTCSLLIQESVERLDALVRRYKAGELRAPEGGRHPTEGA